ncbi:MAG: translation initiation factor IF-2 [Chitinophagaceae bacterium]|nr:translation initiation factor IF-2 [Chitinophagaceae bacterium]
MNESKTKILYQLSKEWNVEYKILIDFLNKKKLPVQDKGLNTKISQEHYELLSKEFGTISNNQNKEKTIHQKENNTDVPSTLDTTFDTNYSLNKTTEKKNTPITPDIEVIRIPAHTPDNSKIIGKIDITGIHRQKKINPVLQTSIYKMKDKKELTGLDESSKKIEKNETETNKLSLINPEIKKEYTLQKTNTIIPTTEIKQHQKNISIEEKKNETEKKKQIKTKEIYFKQTAPKYNENETIKNNPKEPNSTKNENRDDPSKHKRPRIVVIKNTREYIHTKDKDTHNKSTQENKNPFLENYSKNNNPPIIKKDNVTIKENNQTTLIPPVKRISTKDNYLLNKANLDTNKNNKLNYTKPLPVPIIKKNKEETSPPPPKTTELKYKKHDSVDTKSTLFEKKNQKNIDISNKKIIQNRAKYRKDKRQNIAEEEKEKFLQEQKELKILKITEYISANELSLLMDISVNEFISKCMSLGKIISINQRLDADTITIIADEFGFEVKFIEDEKHNEGTVTEEENDTDNMIPRSPIVIVMGHVDHGKTSLLDYIRNTKVVSTESGRITQHIGAYNVVTKNGENITFLDTPGHEAFTAMRSRGAKITDIAIIVIAVDEEVKPMTKEAIKQAQEQNVPIIFAFNKIDKGLLFVEKIKEQLAQMNILVEDWGGKYQCQNISAKLGQGIDELLEKILIEASLLELKWNPKARANGTIIESYLDKGKGYVTVLIVENGILRKGDIILAGHCSGKIKNMFDPFGNSITEAGASSPVKIIGLNGSPHAGDIFKVMESEKIAKEIAHKKLKIKREQELRTKKHITFEEFSQRTNRGKFKELNIIIKADTEGSIEALSDSFLKLSQPEVKVNIIHKAIGEVTESDVNTALISEGIIIAFHTKTSVKAKSIAEKESIEIKNHNVIYHAIDDVKQQISNLLEPEYKEIIVGTIEVKEIFKNSKLGNIAGCSVLDGYIKRNNKVKLIRDNKIIHTGDIFQLKRFKDDVGEVKNGYECGLSIKNYQDVLVGDIIQSIEIHTIKRTI